jgi:hypothetical protein
MASDISVSKTLRGGFWPSSRFGLDVEDEFMDDSTVREEYAEDAPFVGRRRDRPAPSFRVGRDVYVGYFIAVRSADGDLRPFWVARVVGLGSNCGVFFAQSQNAGTTSTTRAVQKRTAVGNFKKGVPT